MSTINSLLNASSSRSVCASRIAQQAARNTIVMVSAPPAQETVLDKQVNTEKKKEFKKPDMYRLFIYNDPVNKRERVVDVLLKTCQGLTFSRAYAAMQEAHENGRGLVLIIAQEIAEHYCATINSDGILSTVEPDK
ncbi:ATP-dependent Clp protease adapter protein CLPS1, chloroplastic [Gracilariopsis chorda]|uniref:ATP-dependent Clp protease adapter protein CLPS1, chloroplastic n=1 Tax=Gracilariopsis chorda TaxID=448386 RepID=A0A2V3IZU2_9FLOR|nr:ATP-dependent Clp protease adapter protein CLPS1, chloroplastic [Gracilariopsis chorda]|eukprot:PXF47595.1 ATP-dependent Clp protease adapter protein CLPS1, chloroplastic [Gracilariopsis chorda]